MYKVVCQLRLPMLLFEQPHRLLTPTSFMWVQQDRSMAGHSKWQNIKHIKALKDMEKSKAICRINQKMQIAIKEYGNADPKVNRRLEHVLEEAKDQKIPNATITKMLDNFTKTKAAGNSELFILKGPGKLLFVINTFYENRNRVKQEINGILNKTGGAWAPISAMHQFECVGKVVCTHYNGNPIKKELLDDSIGHAIEAGAEDVSLEEHEEFGETFVFNVPPLQIYQVKGALLKLGYTCVESDVDYIPTTYIELNEQEMEAAEKMHTKLLENVHVVNVYSNVG